MSSQKETKKRTVEETDEEQQGCEKKAKTDDADAKEDIEGVVKLIGAEASDVKTIRFMRDALRRHKNNPRAVVQLFLDGEDADLYSYYFLSPTRLLGGLTLQQFAELQCRKGPTYSSSFDELLCLTEGEPYYDPVKHAMEHEADLDAPVLSLHWPGFM